MRNTQEEEHEHKRSRNTKGEIKQRCSWSYGLEDKHSGKDATGQKDRQTGKLRGIATKAKDKRRRIANVDDVNDGDNGLAQAK